MAPNQRKGILIKANIEKIIKMMFIISVEVFKIFEGSFKLFLIWEEFVTSLATNRIKMGTITHTGLRFMLINCHFLSTSARITPKPESPIRQLINLSSGFVIPMY